MSGPAAVAARPAPALRDLFLLRPDVVYLNHGSFGACPRPVFARYQELQRELESEPVDFLSLRRRFPASMREARAALAAHVGAEADDLVFFANATSALNVVARSLPLLPGDEVLATNHEYGALDRTWRFVCRRRRAEYARCEVPVPVGSPAEMVEAVWAGVSHRTRVLFLSHVTSPTAVTLPIAPLIRRARDRGILTVIDGAHGPGQLPLALDELGADFYAGNCHKWLLAPKGSAFLHARRERQEMLKPLVVSWGWEPETPGPSRFVDEQEWQGTRDPAAWLAVPAAIAFQREHGWDAVRAGCHELLREARRRVEALTGQPALVADDPALYAQMCSLPLPECDDARLQELLRREHGIEIPVQRWNGRPLIRISIQGYNTEADVEALARALKVSLPAVRR